jgi:hypothetical protein
LRDIDLKYLWTRTAKKLKTTVYVSSN